MKPPPVPPPPRSSQPTSSRSLWVFVLVAILLVPVVALLIWYLSGRHSNASAIRQLENEARQRGEPLTLAELNAKYPPIPDEENAAMALLELWQAEDPVFWLAFENDDRPLPKRAVETYNAALPFLGREAERVARTGSLNSNSLAAANSYLGEKVSHLEQVRAALKKPRFRFPIDIEAGPGALLPHLPTLKTEARNFLLVSLLAAERGDKVGAIAAIRETAQIGQLLAEEPVLLSQLVRRACLSIALHGVEQLLSRQMLTAAELENLRQFLGEINLHGEARIALINERPFSLCIFDPEIAARAAASGSSGDETENPEQAARNVRTGYGFFQSIGLLDRDRRLMLETLKEAIDLAGQETPEALQRTEALFARVDTNAMKFPPKIMSALTLPALQRVASGYAAYEARRRACLIAIAIEQYRLDHEGSLPEKLDALVPAQMESIPADPFDGKNLRFRKLERGYVVYSVGYDLQDDGGKERPDGRRGAAKTRDDTFTVER